MARTITTQLTSKKIKKHLLGSGILTVLALPLWGLFALAGAWPATVFGGFTLLGLSWYGFWRLQQYWHHA